MAYKKADLERRINLTQAEQMFSVSMGSEKDLRSSFMNHVQPLMKGMYGVDVSDIEEEKVFDFSDVGLFKFRVDFWVSTECGKKILIECKNPTHQFRENLSGLTQLMAYRMALNYAGHDVRYLFITPIFSPFILKFIMDYSVPIDVLLLKHGEAGFWSYKML